jgi:hypothetical protein
MKKEPLEPILFKLVDHDEDSEYIEKTMSC